MSSEQVTFYDKIASIRMSICSTITKSYLIIYISKNRIIQEEYGGMHLEQNSDTSGKIYGFFSKIIILYKMLLAEPNIVYLF